LEYLSRDVTPIAYDDCNVEASGNLPRRPPSPELTMRRPFSWLFILHSRQLHFDKGTYLFSSLQGF
jgi:hypothetical protein